MSRRSVVLCEKPSQAENIRAAIGAAFGPVIPAQGHLFTLAPPEHYDEAWKDWGGFRLLRPKAFSKVPTVDPDPGRQRALDAKRRAIRDAIKAADRVIVATDCDREGQVIGTEILDVLGFRGERLRAIFTSEDVATLQAAFASLRPNAEFDRLYQAGLARERADQIYNLSLTRAATTALVPEGVRTVLGVGRVRTPTLAIVCLREMAIARFKPSTSYGLEVKVKAGAAEVALRWRPDDDAPITDLAAAEAMANTVAGRRGPLAVEVARKSRAGPRPADLSTLQEVAGRWGWTASKTMEIAQALYDRHKAITYVRAETRYLPSAAAGDAAAAVSALRQLSPWSAAPAGPPHIRRGKSGVFWDEGLNGESHHAISPNPRTLDRLAELVAAFTADERRLYDVVAGLYLQALAPDHVFDETTLALDLDGRAFSATLRRTTSAGWRAISDLVVDEPRGVGGSDSEAEPPELAAPVAHGELGEVLTAAVTTKTTRAPERFTEGTLVKAMKNAARYVQDPALQARLQDAKGIGTQATRDTIIAGLKDQGFLLTKNGKLHPSKPGMAVFRMLYEAAPEMVDPGKTAVWEHRLDDILRGGLEVEAFVNEIAAETERLLGIFKSAAPVAALGAAVPTDRMVKAALAVQRATGQAPPADFRTRLQTQSDPEGEQGGEGDGG